MSKKIPALNYIKGLATISVISAHCNTVFSEPNVFTNGCSLLLQNIGTFGVICFMVISGMLFHYRKGQMTTFFTKRLVKIVVPWIISATCVWLYVYLRNPPLTLGSWFNFLVGNGSYLYYLTILIGFYVLFTVLPFMRTNVAWCVCEGITVISVLFFPYIGELSPYLNPLNWIGYFAFGMQIMHYRDNLISTMNRMVKWRGAVYALCVLLLAVQLWHGNGGSYWKGFNTVVCWTGAASVSLLGIGLSKAARVWPARVLERAGEESLFIYLWHMPFAGIAANLGSKGMLSYFCLVRPFAVFAVVLGAAVFASWLLKKLKLSGLCPLVGLVNGGN